jgi:hypothetical protein
MERNIMPKDEKGRELLGISPSAVIDGGLSSYGNKTTGVTEAMEDAIFGDDGYDETPATPAQVPAVAPSKPVPPPQQPAPVAKAPDIPDKYEVEPDEEEEGSQEGVLGQAPANAQDDKPAEQGDAVKAVGDAEQHPPTDSEVEIDQKEYDFLKTLEPDQLIARMVSHRKGKSTLQSRVDKLKNAVGDDFFKAVEDGQDVRGASRLLTDLAHPEFQDHLKEFYDSHELRNGQWIRTKQASAPPPDVLSRYTDLISKQAELNPIQFMDKDSEFDANEALARPGSPSGRAYSKYESEKMKLQREIDTILQQSAAVGAPKPEQAREAAAVLKRSWDDLVVHNKELQEQTKLTEFQSFVDTYRNRPLEAFFMAFQHANNGKAATIRLVMKEFDRVSANKSAPVTTQQKVQSAASKYKIKVPNNIKREDVAAVIRDNEVFGDLL